MKDLSWMHNPIIEKMDSRKLAVIVDLMNDTKGKPMEAALPALMKANATLKAQNTSFTSEETAFLMEIFTSDLSPADKMKLEMLKNMMGNRK